MKKIINESWEIIAPSCHINSMVAINPLGGFEDIPFKDALKEASAYFRDLKLPSKMLDVNRESIKWMQVLLDEGQATISLLDRENMLNSWMDLAQHDACLGLEKKWLKGKNPISIIESCLNDLDIDKKDWVLFLRLILCSLHGYSAYIKYLSINLLEDYLAIRLLIFRSIGPEASELLAGFSSNNLDHYKKIKKSEDIVHSVILGRIATRKPKNEPVDAQFLFCIDVRSEPFRNNLESVGRYETFGLGGFFGLPIIVEDYYTGKKTNSCPSLLKAEDVIMEEPDESLAEILKIKKRKRNYNLGRKIYQSLKSNFLSSFGLVEIFGSFCGLWMILKSLPISIERFFNNSLPVRVNIDDISLEKKIIYAEKVLKLIGLVDNFAPTVVICGHGSKTENNAYSSSLNCGACDGQNGAPNARTLAAILNSLQVRGKLISKGIKIPLETIFIAAIHNTTNDEIELFNNDNYTIKNDIEKARRKNCYYRATKLGKVTTEDKAIDDLSKNCYDWSQIRPEWGLAGVSSLIIGPRNLTKGVDLEGKCFLHSYDPVTDIDGANLTDIMTAPMIIAKMISMQYLFSTIDNVAYGGGSKITKNVVGKFGIMQGCGSDLFHGLPLQSLYQDDFNEYHKPVRLMVIIYAPKDRILEVIKNNPKIESLFTGEWLKMICIDSNDDNFYRLTTELIWEHHSKI